MLTKRILTIVALVVLAGASALAGYAVVERRNPVSAITQITQIFADNLEGCLSAKTLTIIKNLRSILSSIPAQNYIFMPSNRP